MRCNILAAQVERTYYDYYKGPIDYEGLQKNLRLWGWYHGKIDGIPGAKTRAGFTKLADRVHCKSDGSECWET